MWLPHAPPGSGLPEAWFLAAPLAPFHVLVTLIKRGLAAVLAQAQRAIPLRRRTLFAASAPVLPFGGFWQCLVALGRRRSCTFSPSGRPCSLGDPAAEEVAFVLVWFEGTTLPETCPEAHSGRSSLVDRRGLSLLQSQAQDGLHSPRVRVGWLRVPWRVLVVVFVRAVGLGWVRLMVSAPVSHPWRSKRVCFPGLSGLLWGGGTCGCGGWHVAGSPPAQLAAWSFVFVRCVAGVPLLVLSWCFGSLLNLAPLGLVWLKCILHPHPSLVGWLVVGWLVAWLVALFVDWVVAWLVGLWVWGLACCRLPACTACWWSFVFVRCFAGVPLLVLSLCFGSLLNLAPLGLVWLKCTHPSPSLPSWSVGWLVGWCRLLAWWLVGWWSVGRCGLWLGWLPGCLPGPGRLCLLAGCLWFGWSVGWLVVGLLPSFPAPSRGRAYRDGGRAPRGAPGKGGRREGEGEVVWVEDGSRGRRVAVDQGIECG